MPLSERKLEVVHASYILQKLYILVCKLIDIRKVVIKYLPVNRSTVNEYGI